MDSSGWHRVDAADVPDGTRVRSVAVDGRAVAPCRRRWTWAAAAVAVVAVGAGLALFEPWKLWVDEAVNEAPPVAAAPPTVAGSPSGPASPAAGPELLGRGAFVSHEHATTGSAQLVRAADGTRYLRLEDLDTSNGPQLQV